MLPDSSPAGVSGEFGDSFTKLFTGMSLTPQRPSIIHDLKIHRNVQCHMKESVNVQYHMKEGEC